MDKRIKKENKTERKREQDREKENKKKNKKKKRQEMSSFSFLRGRVHNLSSIVTPVRPALGGRRRRVEEECWEGGQQDGFRRATSPAGVVTGATVHIPRERGRERATHRPT